MTSCKRDAWLMPAAPRGIAQDWMYCGHLGFEPVNIGRVDHMGRVHRYEPLWTPATGDYCSVCHRRHLQFCEGFLVQDGPYRISLWNENGDVVACVDRGDGTMGVGHGGYAYLKSELADWRVHNLYDDRDPGWDRDELRPAWNIGGQMLTMTEWRAHRAAHGHDLSPAELDVLDAFVVACRWDREP